MLCRPEPHASLDADAAKICADVSLTWAFNAYARFVARLSPEVRRHLGDRREDSYTVVFGRTQVGKSTLILHLLGVRADAIEAVSRVLRGGRKSGNSSTALPTEYRRSRDDCWRIRWGGETWVQSSDDDALVIFGALREKMEFDGSVLSGHLCDVEIPDRHFCSAALGIRGSRVLDLPGAEAANALERRFVARVAESLVPNADLVLLVGRADDLTFLLPDQLNLPGISDWQLSPRRFRVVTTYSFTPASVREFVKETGCRGDAAAYRERLISQIQRYRLLEPAAQAPELYFPLEFGASWQSATDLHSSQLVEMVDGLMQQLRLDIAQSSTSISRLEGALYSRVLVAKAHAEHLEEIDREQQRLRSALERRRSHVEDLGAALQRKKKELARLEAALATLSDQAVVEGALAPGKRLSQWADTWWREMERQIEGLPRLDRTADLFLSLIGEAIDGIKAQIPDTVHMVLTRGAGDDDGEIAEPALDLPPGENGRFWKQVYSTAGMFEAMDIAGAADRAFAELRATLEGYWSKLYWSTGGRGRYRDDLTAFGEAYGRFVVDVSKQLEVRIKGHADASRRRMLSKSHRLDMQAIQTRQAAAVESAAMVRIEEQAAQCQLRREQAERLLAEELRLSRQFTHLLAEEYDKAVEQAHSDVLTAPDAVTAFQHLVMASTLRDSHESVWTRISGVMEQ